MRTTTILVVVMAVVWLQSCKSSSGSVPSSLTGPKNDSNTIICLSGSSKLDIAAIERITGMKGAEKNGEYKITVPQNDLQVVVDGFRIIPPMGLGSWACFVPCRDSAMVMGDIVLTETDLFAVQEEVIRQGFTVTGIHNHFIRDHPNVMYMHVDGKGSVIKMAEGVKAIFQRVKVVRGHDPKEGKADSVTNTLSFAKLDAILGQKGELSKGVYKYIIGRPDVMLQEHGIPISSFAGFNTWAAWQGSEEKAAVAGDFAMLEDEVAPVINTLIKNGIEVVAVHNHMVHEKPHIFFLHYWGTGPAEKLAIGLKKALAQTGRAKVH